MMRKQGRRTAIAACGLGLLGLGATVRDSTSMPWNAAPATAPASDMSPAPSARVLPAWLFPERDAANAYAVEANRKGYGVPGVHSRRLEEADAPQAKPDICEPGGGGLFFPLFGESEQGWPMGLRTVLYLVGLLWSFLGVGIISDVFMAAIETIVATEKVTTMPDGTKITFLVWNGTVANLTLMALGSSAPEILLSVIEITTSKFYAGALGPSTIVGSAAFNLLIIIAVCVIAIPETEPGRKVAQTDVFLITAFASVFAYVWLLVILQAITPDSIDVWEGLATFLFFPVLVYFAYGADKGWFARTGKVAPGDHIIAVGGKHFHPYQVTELLKELNAESMSEAEMAQLAGALVSKGSKPSRAQLRMNAIRQMTGQKRVVPPPVSMKALEAKYAPSAKDGEDPSVPKINFASTKYAVLENQGGVTTTVFRTPATGKTTVSYQTVDGTATGGAIGPDGKPFGDYENTAGDLVFEDGESQKEISVKIFDDDEVEEDETFTIKLTKVLNGVIGVDSEALITIIDDDEPGELGFHEDAAAVTVVESDKEAHVKVNRFNGSSGQISCKWRTKPLEKPSALAGSDYEHAEGELIFAASEITKTVSVPLVESKSYDKSVTFSVELFDMKGPVERISFHKITVANVTIVSDAKSKEMIDNITKMVNADMDKYSVGTSAWKDQFTNALAIMGEDCDDAPGKMDYFMHVLTLPLKLLFAIVPPTSYAGGWACFVCALIMIGGVTACIGDLASLFGCSIGLKPSVTAITFVALGTSLPDTFASKAAAISDDTADAALGNVTGSNAVNVFLGLGMPWLMGALFWNGGVDCEWYEKYGIQPGMCGNAGDTTIPGTDLQAPLLSNDYPDGAFAVPAGSLGFSVTVFTCCALACLALLYYRRQTLGAELGGPDKTAKMHSCIFTSLWFVYILMSSLYDYGHI